MWSVGVAMAACSSIRESTLDIIVSPIELVLAPTVATGDGGKRGIEAAEVVWNPTPAICCCIRSPAIIEGVSLGQGMPTWTPGMYWLPSDGKSPTEDAMTLSKKWDWWLSVRTWDSATQWQKKAYNQNCLQNVIQNRSTFPPQSSFKTGTSSLRSETPKLNDVHTLPGGGMLGRLRAGFRRGHGWWKTKKKKWNHGQKREWVYLKGHCRVDKYLWQKEPPGVICMAQSNDQEEKKSCTFFRAIVVFAMMTMARSFATHLTSFVVHRVRFGSDSLESGLDPSPGLT